MVCLHWPNRNRELDQEWNRDRWNWVQYPMASVSVSASLCNVYSSVHYYMTQFSSFHHIQISRVINGLLTLPDTETNTEADKKNGLYRFVWKCSYCTKTVALGCTGLCWGIHTAQRERTTRIPIGFCILFYRSRSGYRSRTVWMHHKSQQTLNILILLVL